MLDFLATIFSPDLFEPHGVHFWATPWLLWSDITANILIAIAYTTIPVGLIYFLKRRKDLAFNWIFGVFATFIFACAVTHMLHTVIYFYGFYYLQAIADILTALISLTAAVLVWYVIPLALKIPNPKEFARAQEEARRREHELEVQKRFELERNEFVSSISHELKTPLTSQLILTELLEEIAEREGAKVYSDHLARIRSQSQKLTKLVSDLLDLIRSEGHSIATDFSEVNVNELIRTVVDEQQVSTKTHSIETEGRISDALWADKERLGNVVSNLISNAIKYSPHGNRITVRLRDAGDVAEISVQDHGIGIDPAHHKKIFDRFFRIAGSTQKTYPGMGVGLFLCAEIVREHGGEIRVESALGKGSTFIFTIPFAANTQVAPHPLIKQSQPITI